MVFQGKMCGKVFYAMNNLGIAHFSSFVIEYIFKAIIFIHAAFIIKVRVFLKIFILEISNIPQILYFSPNFTFNNAPP